MTNITDYKVLKAETSDGITKQVNDLIQQGWQPIEGVKITTEGNQHDGTSIFFYQTIMKYEQ